MVKAKFSKDPKTRLVSLQELIEQNPCFLFGIPENQQWPLEEPPKPNQTYYQITDRYFIVIHFGSTSRNYGLDITEKLDSIEIAQRDGETEYSPFDETILKLKQKRGKRNEAKIACIEQAKRCIPSFRPENEAIQETRFIDCLVDTGYKTESKKRQEHYVVLDVETNGLRRKNDDLLSISLYDPSTGLCYNRFLPLDLQPTVMTGYINGITNQMLECYPHLSQKEMDDLIAFFDLKNAIILSYAGGKGLFDAMFVMNYCARHGITGFDNMRFENIKSAVPLTTFETSSELSKDNLCNILGIEGVSKHHTGMNDCLLEWKLFEKLMEGPLLLIENQLYHFTEGYIMPISYLDRHPELERFLSQSIPSIQAFVEPLFSYEFPKSSLRKIKKLDTNILGITIEHSINTLVGAEAQNNQAFLCENRRKLDYVGSLSNRLKTIPVALLENGTIASIDPKYDEEVDEINSVTQEIANRLSSTIAFIKSDIFPNETIFSQEMVISSDNKILALCDLSSPKSVLEIKTFNPVVSEGENLILPTKIARQLFFQKRGRNTYLLTIDFSSHYGRSGLPILDGVSVTIWDVTIKEN